MLSVERIMYMQKERDEAKNSEKVEIKAAFVVNHFFVLSSRRGRRSEILEF